MKPPEHFSAKSSEPTKEESIRPIRPTAPGIAYRHLFRFERDPGGRGVSAVVTMERLKNVRLFRVGARIG